MKTVFLCGGVGNRMFPITEDKFSLKFVGKTLLEHQIETAKEAGLSQFVIIGNPQNIGKIEEIVKKVPDIKFELAVQKEARGIADALISAQDLIDGDILVQSSNDIVEASAYISLLESKDCGSAVSYLLGYEVNDYFPGGYLVVGEDGRLIHIIEKPGRGKEPSNLVNILVHLHTNPRSLLRYAAGVRTKKDDIYECAINAMVKDTGGAKVVPYAGLWGTIKYPWHVLSMARRFLERSEGYVASSARISEKATIEGKVTIMDEARILENAVIKGPVYIGRRSVIGTGSLVRDYSHIGENCLVGYATEIKNSYVGDNCWFHKSYVGDSIISDGCSFGAGTVLSNLRFDEKNIEISLGEELVDTGLEKLGAIIGAGCKTGVNASVMPGVRIGPNSVVGPGVCLVGDLGQDQFAQCEPSYYITDSGAVLTEEKRPLCVG